MKLRLRHDHISTIRLLRHDHNYSMGEKMHKGLTVILAVSLLISAASQALAPRTSAESYSEISANVIKIAGYILETVQDPQVGTSGGEWAVLGLARSGYDVPDSYYEKYYKNVEKYVKDSGGVMSNVRYTEYSRIILALTAAGYDPRSVAGYDLTAALEDLDNVFRQGINSMAYALLALDSMNYPSTRREYFLSEILRRQLNDGGWSLAGTGSDESKTKSSDPDITGMVLQALAKYQNDPSISAATARALDLLSKMQRDNGGYIGWEEENIESTTQVLAALCELGIRYDDPRFVKGGKTLVDSIMSYMNQDFGFSHTPDSAINNQMSTEQALYSLAAVQRQIEGNQSLYRMTDTLPRGSAGSGDAFAAQGTGLPGKDPRVSAMPVIHRNMTFPDISGHVSQSEIEELAARGIINGKDGGLFDPSATMTRAEFAAVITRGLGLLTNPQPLAVNEQFLDVKANDWFYPFVYSAASYGIVKGVSDTAFDPNSKISKQEAAVMITRAAGLCGLSTSRGETEIRNTLAQFGDYRSAADWAAASLAFCYDTGILDDSEFNIDPGVPILRHEIAVMLYRMLLNANLI